MEPATKQDLQNLATELRDEMGVLRTDVAVLKTDVAVLKTDVAVLKTDVAVLKTDVAVLKTDVAELKIEVTAVRSDMVSMEQRLMRAINEAVTHAANVIFERTRDFIRALDDKYSHLPAEVTAIRHDLDEHRGDLRLHSRPTAPARRVARKSRAR
jgi:chromosome segregation ATPase